MTDHPEASPGPAAPPPVPLARQLFSAGPTNAMLVYGLYLVSLSIVVALLTLVIGVAMAYVNREKSPPWLRSHYTFQIHTFWKALLFVIVGIVTAFALVGYIFLLPATIWFVVRCVKGFVYASDGEPIADPKSWLFG